jgi:tRNA A37 threonylcarbamoyladenosine dehydratase
LDRTARLLGDAAMRRLAASHVSVFGLGGVGSYAVEGLARSGVGHLTLVDFDHVCITNFNRQLHAVQGAVGRAKSDLMAERVRGINPDITVEPVCAFYESATADRLLASAPDLVLDCIDNVTAKLHLIAQCIERGIPVVTCLGAAAKLDPSRVRVATLGDTHTDRLARAIRRNLRKRYGLDDKTIDRIPAVFSDEEVVWPDAEASGSLCGTVCVCPAIENRKHSCRHRSVIHGSVVFVTSVFGMTAAAWAVRFLSGKFPVDLKPVRLKLRERCRRQGSRKSEPHPEAE